MECNAAIDKYFKIIVDYFDNFEVGKNNEISQAILSAVDGVKSEVARDAITIIVNKATDATLGLRSINAVREAVWSATWIPTCRATFNVTKDAIKTLK